MTKFCSCGDSHFISPSSSLFNGIVFGRHEIYDPQQVPVWRFSSANDVRNGIQLDLGNMCGGYPFFFYGHRFHTSESAYQCGDFSQGVAETGKVQRALLMESNGWKAKKEIKKPNAHLIRSDWKEFMFDWMLLVVWAKCKGNTSFARKLKSLPQNAVIVEDCTFISGIWGCKNKELRKAYTGLKKNLESRGMCPTAAKKVAGEKMVHFSQGLWEGENNMGKVLKMCQLALLHNVEPPIDYDNLRKHNIYLFGKELTFKEAC